MKDYIWYVMLNVGDGRRVPRAEIGDALIETVRPLIEKDGIKPLPDIGAKLISTRHGSILYCTVRKDGRDLGAFAAARRSRGDGELWQELHATGLDTFATDPDTPPQAPWVALALSAEARRLPRSVVHYMIGLAKASGWAWLETQMDS